MTKGTLASVREWVKRGASLNHSGALAMVADTRQAWLVEALLAMGAHVNSRNDKFLTPLQVAFDDPQCVKVETFKMSIIACRCGQACQHVVGSIL